MNNIPDISLFHYSQPLHMRWSDCDALGHVNNALYLTYAEQVRVDYLDSQLQWNWQETGLILAKATVNFLRPLLYRDDAYIHTRCARLGTKSFDMDSLIMVKTEDTYVPYTYVLCTLVMFDYKTEQPFAIPNRIRQQFVEVEEGSLASI